MFAGCMYECCLVCSETNHTHTHPLGQNTNTRPQYFEEGAALLGNHINTSESVQADMIMTMPVNAYCAGWNGPCGAKITA